ncbi:MAG: hypothetical protein AAFV25_01285 [Bacteroidota bacterium]
MPTKFYPPVSALISSDALPSELGFVKDGISNLLSKIYFRDLQYSVSDKGDKGFYSMGIVSLTRIDIEIPGTGLFLVLNPSHDPDNPDISEFPISLQYDWPVLGYLRNFDLSTFSFQPSDFFDLALAILDVSEAQMLDRVLQIFISGPNPINTFVDDVNAMFGTAIPHPVTPSPIDEVINEINNASGINGMGAVVFSVYILDALSDGNTDDRFDQFFSSFFDGDFKSWLKRLLTPKIDATLSVSAGIEFPRNVLLPLNAVGGTPLPAPTRSMLTFDPGKLYFSTERGIGFDEDITVRLDHPSTIGNTGFGISMSLAKLDISRTENIPEADRDGRPADFVGVYIEEASLSFPQFWNHDDGNSTGIIKGKQLVIGTGGLSGTLSLEAKAAGSPAPFVKVKFGSDFSISLDRFSMTFQQNKITNSLIEGTLTLPGFDDANGEKAEIRIKIDIQEDGDFNITVYEDDGFKEIRFSNIFAITIKSLYFGKKDDDFYFGLSGCIKFLEPTISGLLKGDFCVEKLLIWSDGRIEIEGGTLPLPQGAKIKIGPAEIAITAIHFGSHQQEHGSTLRRYRYFGFDGGISLDPGGVDARGDGIKFFYSVDGLTPHRFLRIQSISLDLIIPGNASKETATALISGYLAVKEAGTGTVYEGGIKFALPKAKIAGGASIKYNPSHPSWIVNASVELASPIPLGATGLGIYGFRGLLGQRYVASKSVVNLTDDDTWFQYYKKTPEGIDVSKFAGPDQTADADNAFSVGAGVSLATTADGGKSFSLKLFLMLSLPELFYLEGKANVLGERVGLIGNDPPFSAFLAVSPSSVETGFGADYNIPQDSGQILDLYAEVQAGFFFQDPKAWYINFGREDKRITARILSLFDATAYLMLSAAGIRAGAGVSWGFKKKYAGGMVRASVGVYIEVGGQISFERPQIGGFALLGGHVDVYLLWVGFNISIDTSLFVEAPKPFLIKGSVRLCVGITIGFWKFKKRIEKCFNVEFKWEKSNLVDTSPVKPFNDAISNSSSSTDSLPFSAVNILSQEDFPVDNHAPGSGPLILASFGTSLPSQSDAKFNNSILPLDTYVDIEFKKPVLPDAVDVKIGRQGLTPSGYQDLVPPLPEARQVVHRYSVEDVEIYAWNGSSWVTYHPYEAMAIPAALNALSADPSRYRMGFWQAQGNEYNRLRLLSQTPLNWTTMGESGWYVPEQFGITSTSLFCEGKRRERKCVHWMDVGTSTSYADGQFRQKGGLVFRIIGDDGQVLSYGSHFGTNQSMAFDTKARVEVYFSEPSPELSMKLTTWSREIQIHFFEKVSNGASWEFQLIESRVLSAYQVLAPVMYDNPDRSVGKIEIVSCQESDDLDEEMMRIRVEQLRRAYFETLEQDKERANKILEEIRQLTEQLTALRSPCCDLNLYDASALEEYLDQLVDKEAKCKEELAKLKEEGQKVCKEYRDFSDQFHECFPHQPSRLSHEIYQERDEDGIDEYRFRIWDKEERKIVLSSSQRYPSPSAARSEMWEAVRCGMEEKSYQLESSKDQRFYFNIVNDAQEVIARRIEYFASAEDRKKAASSLEQLLKESLVEGEIRIPDQGFSSEDCPVCLDHLDCWEKGKSKRESLGKTVDRRGNILRPTGESTRTELILPDECDAIIERIKKATDKFCAEYNRLYKEWYDCNYRIYLRLQRECAKFEERCREKEKECRDIELLIEYVRRLMDWIKEGNGQPPREENCPTLLHEICYYTWEDWQWNSHIPGQAAIEEQFQSMQAAIQNMLAPVWRPDTKYAVKIGFRDSVEGPTTNTDHSFDHYFGFQTVGPLGYFHEHAQVKYVAPGTNPDQYALTGLRSYIDYQRSYPNADGNLVRAKPLFYEDARLLVFYTQNYVYHFFGDWPAYKGLPAITGSGLQVVVKDPKEDVSIPNPLPIGVTNTNIPQAIVDWPQDSDPRIPADILQISHLRNPELLNDLFPGADCYVSGGDLIRPAAVHTEITMNYLKPLKLYTALFNNLYKGDSREIHRYVFQTSRYPHFGGQVNSYQLDDGQGNTRDAIFGMETAASNADINTGYDILRGTLSAANTALATAYADPFDRLIEGAWKLAPLDAAVSTEFNILRQHNTNKVFAVWIRNPEPFNDPKIPDAALSGSLAVLSGGLPDANYHVLFSKDRSQALVMNAAKNITAANLRFRFRYLEWNGSAYVAAATVNTGSISMTP